MLKIKLATEYFTDVSAANLSSIKDGRILNVILVNRPYSIKSEYFLERKRNQPTKVTEFS